MLPTLSLVIHSFFLQMEGGPWQEELLFAVPRDHEEIARLEGRYKK